jgi:two-component system nitrate/nitrite response regulator NarL
MPRGTPLTRITIVDDHQLFAEALELVLAHEGHDVHRVEVPAHSVSVEHLIAAIRRQRPQVVMLDLGLGTSVDGSRLIAPLRARGFEVIVVSGTTDRSLLGECLRLGARAVIPKSASLNVLLSRLRCVVGGLPAMPRQEREELLELARLRHQWGREAQDRLDSLSQREAEVLAELMAGRRVDDIALASFVSVATVRTQVKAILRKLGVSSQLAAVGLAQGVGWRPQPGRFGPLPDLDDSSRRTG